MNSQEVREIRDKLGFTQQQLAREVGVHKNTVARWERNEMAVRESTARLLAFVVSGVRERGPKPASTAPAERSQMEGPLSQPYQMGPSATGLGSSSWGPRVSSSNSMVRHGLTANCAILSISFAFERESVAVSRWTLGNSRSSRIAHLRLEESEVW